MLEPTIGQLVLLSLYQKGKGTVFTHSKPDFPD